MLSAASRAREGIDEPRGTLASSGHVGEVWAEAKGLVVIRSSGRCTDRSGCGGET